MQLDINRMKRHFDNLVTLMHRSRELGIRLLSGTDSGNNTFTPYGQLHAKEPEIFVRFGGYSPMEAIIACTRDNAFAVGMAGEVGELKPGMLADVIVLERDPLADITVLQGGRHLAWVIKDGKVVDFGRAGRRMPRSWRSTTRRAERRRRSLRPFGLEIVASPA